MEEIDDLKQMVASIGYDYEQTSDKIKKYLNVIYGHKLRVDSRVKCANDDLQENPYSILQVSEVLDCSRTTIYNNPIIKEFIEELNLRLDDENPYKKVEKLEEKVRFQNEKIEKMYKRDIDIKLLRKENKELKEKLGIKDNLIKLNKS